MKSISSPILFLSQPSSSFSLSSRQNPRRWNELCATLFSASTKLDFDSYWSHGYRRRRGFLVGGTEIRGGELVELVGRDQRVAQVAGRSVLFSLRCLRPRFIRGAGTVPPPSLFIPCLFAFSYFIFMLKLVICRW